METPKGNYEFDNHEHPNEFRSTQEFIEANEGRDEDDDFLNADGEDDDFEDIEETISDIDFSSLSGDFRSSMKQINKKLTSKKAKNKKSKGPSKFVAYRKGSKFASGKGKFSKVIVPRDKNVIIEGVSKFIVSDAEENQATKNIGYYNGKKLKELLLIINNDTPADFEIELFNTASPLDYLYSTSGNLNDRIKVAGGFAASYAQVLYHLASNPTMIVNAKFVVAGPTIPEQIREVMKFKNQNIEGKQKVTPFQMNLNIDLYQEQNDIVYFDLMSSLNRPFIPDGMDVLQYKVLKGMTVVLAFYYKQISMKKYFFPEARKSKELI